MQTKDSMKFREMHAKFSEMDPELSQEALKYYPLKETIRGAKSLETFVTVLRDQVKRVVVALDDRGRAIVQSVSGIDKESKEGLDTVLRRATVLEAFVELNIAAVSKAFHQIRKHSAGKPHGGLTQESITRDIEKSYASIRENIMGALATLSNVRKTSSSAPAMEGMKRASIGLVPREGTMASALYLLNQAQSYSTFTKNTKVFYDTPELMAYRKNLDGVCCQQESEGKSRLMHSFGGSVIIPSVKLMDLLAGRWDTADYRTANPSEVWDSLLESITGKDLRPCVQVTSEQSAFSFDNGKCVVLVVGAVTMSSLDMRQMTPTVVAQDFPLPYAVVEVWTSKDGGGKIPSSVPKEVLCNDFSFCQAATAVHYAHVVDEQPKWFASLPELMTADKTYHRRLEINITPAAKVPVQTSYSDSRPASLRIHEDWALPLSLSAANIQGGSSFSFNEEPSIGNRLTLGNNLSAPSSRRRRRRRSQDSESGSDSEDETAPLIPKTVERVLTLPKVEAHKFVVNPKTYFSNERTFLHWQHLALILIILSFGLIKYSEHKPGVVVDVLLQNVYYYCGILGVSLGELMLVYSLALFYYRLYIINYNKPSGYYDLVSPVVVSLIVFTLIMTVLLSSISEGFGYKSSPLPRGSGGIHPSGYKQTASTDDIVWRPILDCNHAVAVYPDSIEGIISPFTIAYTNATSIFGLVSDTAVLLSDGAVWSIDRRSYLFSMNTCLSPSETVRSAAQISSTAFLVVSSVGRIVHQEGTDCRDLTTQFEQGSADNGPVVALTASPTTHRVAVLHSLGVASQKCVAVWDSQTGEIVMPCSPVTPTTLTARLANSSNALYIATGSNCFLQENAF